METDWRAIIGRQFAASIDMLENALVACPDELWSDRTRQTEFWYVVFHTLFYLDLYLSGTTEGFAPPAPYTLDEMNPAGVLPERAYTKDELHAYLKHGREKCRTVFEELMGEQAQQRCVFTWGEMSYAELLLDNMRHVQHHAAQLNLILRQTTDAAPLWVGTTKKRD